MVPSRLRTKEGKNSDEKDQMRQGLSISSAVGTATRFECGKCIGPYILNLRAYIKVKTALTSAMQPSLEVAGKTEKVSAN